MACVFCNIAEGSLPATKVYEDEAMVAFEDIHPKAPIHVLVIPKRHIESIAHLECDHAEDIATLIYTAKHVAETRELKGYKIVFNVGREGGQTVDHLHLHLLGGWASAEERQKGFNV